MCWWVHLLHGHRLRSPSIVRFPADKREREAGACIKPPTFFSRLATAPIPAFARARVFPMDSQVLVALGLSLVGGLSTSLGEKAGNNVSVQSVLPSSPSSVLCSGWESLYVAVYIFLFCFALLLCSWDRRSVPLFFCSAENSQCATATDIWRRKLGEFVLVEGFRLTNCIRNCVRSMNSDFWFIFNW